MLQFKFKTLFVNKLYDNHKLLLGTLFMTNF